ncbi:MAG: DUF5677 domain-containing protein [Oryzomonas sp.]|uniref:DUF5677 domain-containing protein n=1 Tax=Oryzomonas sp. TaxID=2855186 RepID=UPI00284113F4|nr:DUF5677 domain-containing protein [Oryzomonas sp.]MDR3579667.1 DUF5677 domain-containing protein [Oryzomonas sp.]
MAPYSKNGFLGEDVKVWIDDNRQHYLELFMLAEQFNSICYESLREVSLSNKDNKKHIISCLFLRIMEHFQGTYVLVTRGMVSSANVMLRALIEAMFVLVSISKDDDALKAYVLNDELERLKLANKIIEDKDEVYSEADKKSAKQIKSEIQDTLKEIKYLRYRTEDFARIAGLHNWYTTVYAFISRSVHATIKDMEQHLDLDECYNVKSIKLIPNDNGTLNILTTACNALNISLQSFLTVLEKNTDVCTINDAKLKPYLEEALKIHVE